MDSQLLAIALCFSVVSIVSLVQFCRLQRLYAQFFTDQKVMHMLLLLFSVSQSGAAYFLFARDKLEDRKTEMNSGRFRKEVIAVSIPDLIFIVMVLVAVLLFSRAYWNTLSFKAYYKVVVLPIGVMLTLGLLLVASLAIGFADTNNNYLDSVQIVNSITCVFIAVTLIVLYRKISALLTDAPVHMKILNDILGRIKFVSHLLFLCLVAFALSTLYAAFTGPKSSIWYYDVPVSCWLVIFISKLLVCASINW
mmetsp:Transcript_3345/g.4501  ORF Transcript_3345/g.4501 Transcript_3345/m.4501 type:complete len:251 (-) Transcript_3345:510-1262(-)